MSVRLMVCPECGQGKHVNCTAYVLDPSDELVPCQCDHGRKP